MPRKARNQSLSEYGFRSPKSIPPVLRWAGSKSKLVPRVKSDIPAHYGRLIEPFAGSAAIFFGLAPQRAILADTNLELIIFYEVLRDTPDALLWELEQYAFSDDFYYGTRNRDPKKMLPVQRAARFYYLNRFCWNGLYRVNSKGQFNVPIGRFKATPKVYDRGALALASHALQGKLVLRQDFRKTLGMARAGDVLYVDPPYDIELARGFKQYTDDCFDKADHRELAAACADLARSGVYVIVSNAATKAMERLYSRYAQFSIETFSVSREINSKSERRSHGSNEMYIVSRNISTTPV